MSAAAYSRGPSVRWSLFRSIILVVSVAAFFMVLAQWRWGLPFVRSTDLTEYDIQSAGPVQTWTVMMPKSEAIPDNLRSRAIVEINGRTMVYYEKKAADLGRARDGSFWVRYRRVNFRLAGFDPDNVSRAVLKIPRPLPIWGAIVLLPVFGITAWAASRKSSPARPGR